MVNCSANGCSNRGEKGYSMKSFPRDENIRKKWQANVNRIDWQPTNHSKLCEVHFSQEMWEKPRVDGKKKLKWNAIPTIFPQHRNRINRTKSQNTSKQKIEHSVLFVATSNDETSENEMKIETTVDPLNDTTTSEVSTNVKDILNNFHPNSFVSQSSDIIPSPRNMIVNIENPSIFHNYAQPPPPPPLSKETPSKTQQNSQGVQVNYESIIKINNSPLSSSIFSESFVSDVNIPSTLNNSDLFKKIYQYQKSYTQLLAKVNNYKEQIKGLKQRNDRLVKIAKKDRHLRLLKHIFNDDQICALERSNCRFMKWTQGTLINALRLKNYCGIDGYEEILRQKIPLPSIRTLNRIKITDAVNSMIGTNNFVA